MNENLQNRIKELESYKNPDSPNGEYDRSDYSDCLVRNSLLKELEKALKYLEENGKIIN